MGNDGAAAAVAFGTERGAPALHPPAVPGEGVEMKTVPRTSRTAAPSHVAAATSLLLTWARCLCLSGQPAATSMR